jgi:hypothetical protein
MLYPLLAGALVSFVNFAIHAIMTGLIVVATRHTATLTDHMHVFGRVSTLLLITVVTLTCTHILEIAVWAMFYELVGLKLENAPHFEFAFENYTAVGYGDVVAYGEWRLIGPVTALNGLLLIGWSVAIIFEVLRMAEVHIGRKPQRLP